MLSSFGNEDYNELINSLRDLAITKNDNQERERESQLNQLIDNIDKSLNTYSRFKSAIDKSIIALAHELQLKVVAEGVEDKNVLECLIKLGCDEIQGYFVSYPLPRIEFETNLRNQCVNWKIYS